MTRSKPNILWLLSDEHSFRCVGETGENALRESVQTPTLDRLAQLGTTFEQSYCPVPVCTPARLCLLTGMEAHHCGAWANSSMLQGDHTTLAETLSNEGYISSLAGKMHLGGDRQFAGFDRRPYGDLTGYHGHQGEPLPDRAAGLADDLSRIKDAGVTEIPESVMQEYRVVQETVSFVREQSSLDTNPWFACASFSRPHFPLTAPRRYITRYWDLELDEPTERFSPPAVEIEAALDHPIVRADRNDRFGYDRFDRAELMRARACYFACVEFIDDVIGDLLGTLGRSGLLENTIVIYTSDHGELAGEQGLWWKSVWHEGSTRVPFIVQTPDQRAGTTRGNRIQTPVSLIDLFPTICALADVRPPDTLDGVDLSEAVTEGTEPDSRPVYCDNLNPMWGEGSEYRMVRAGSYKYVKFRDNKFRDLLFDLDADPFETTNIGTGGDDEASSVRNSLSKIVSETVDFAAAERDRVADRRQRQARQLQIDRSFRPDRGGLNAYHLPNGNVVETEGTLYRPRVITSTPEETYADYPSSPPE